MAIGLDDLAIHVIVNTIILSPVLWLAGRAVVGKEKAKFTDAVFTIIIGTVVGAIFGYFFADFTGVHCFHRGDYSAHIMACDS